MAATQADHTLFLARIVETMNEHTTRFDHVESLLHAHTELLNMILERLPAKE
jgi:hypothetical protein